MCVIYLPKGDEPPGWCCDGYACGGFCDPWCDAHPAEQEAWHARQHTGVLEVGDTHCDSAGCWCNDDQEPA